jgi:hypothetical protein
MSQDGNGASTSAQVLARRGVQLNIATVAFDDGRVIQLRAGDLFYVPPVPHDSWVIGDQPYVSLHFLGAENYATESQG